MTGHRADVGKESDWIRFRDEMLTQHNAKSINLLFNNAGVGAGGGFINGSGAEWEKTFEICWYGVYYGCRVFMPLLVASTEEHIINTSSGACWLSGDRTVSPVLTFAPLTQ